MNSITLMEMFAFLFLISSCFGTSHEIGDDDNLKAEEETDTGDVAPWLKVIQLINTKLEEIDKTAKTLDTLVNNNRYLLTAVEVHLKEAIAKPPCNCCQDQTTSTPAAPSQGQNSSSDVEGLNKTTMAPEPTSKLKIETIWSTLQKSLRDLLKDLEKNYTLTGPLKNLYDEMHEN